MRWPAAIQRLSLALFAVAAFAGTAGAQVCSVSIAPVAFGVVDTLSAGATDTASTVSVNCLGVTGTVRVCLSLGTPGGSNAGGRLMPGPSGSLQYQLYTDAARSQAWGSYVSGYGGGGLTIDLPVTGLGGSTTRTLYGRVPGSQATAVPGGYADVYAGGSATFSAQLLSVLPCTSLLSLSGSAPFRATASVQKTCLVSATDVDFGTKGVLSTSTDATGQVSVRCSGSTPYEIGLSGGNGGATDPTLRKMTNAAQSVVYGLYRNAARNAPWGSSSGVNTVQSTGTGSTQILTIFGRVPVQSTPAPGVYTDTVVVTVTY